MKFALPLIALLATTAQAQEFHWGVHFGPVFPQGDLGKALEHKVGLGGDLHLLVDFGGSHMLRGRLGGMDFKQSTDSTGNNLTVRATSGAVDYMWFAQGSSVSGFFLFGGLEWTKWNSDRSGTFTGTGQEVKSSIGGSLGFGYQFTRAVGVEASYFQSRFRQTQGAANGIMVGFSYRL